MRYRTKEKTTGIDRTVGHFYIIHAAQICGNWNRQQPRTNDQTAKERVETEEEKKTALNKRKRKNSTTMRQRKRRLSHPAHTAVPYNTVLDV